MTDELARLATVAAKFATRVPYVRIGIGDDAAVLTAAALRGGAVLTVDAAVDHVHFERSWAPLDVLARRAFVTAASDLAAMGARPRAALSSLILPPDIDDAAFTAILDGLAAASHELSAPIVGGNLSSGTELSLTTTVIGDVEGEPLRRTGARVGDHVYVTGQLGLAALGLRVVAAKLADRKDAAPFVDRLLRPNARLTEGARLRELGATSCIDISDGAIQDLEHICRASSVGADLEVALLPLAPGAHELAALIGLDADLLALTGGDDYELLYTAPADVSADELGTRIGRVTAKSGIVRIIDVDGRDREVKRGGYRHFG